MISVILNRKAKYLIIFVSVMGFFLGNQSRKDKTNAFSSVQQYANESEGIDLFVHSFTSHLFTSHSVHGKDEAFLLTRS